MSREKGLDIKLRRPLAKHSFFDVESKKQCFPKAQRVLMQIWDQMKWNSGFLFTDKYFLTKKQ